MIFGRKDKGPQVDSPPVAPASMNTGVAITLPEQQRPRDDELDLFGITHAGRVRPDNQDHYLVCTVHPQAVVQGTSLPHPEKLPLRGQRLATLMLVADGVGGGAGGSEASQLALEAVMRFAASGLRSYQKAGSASEKEFEDELSKAALEAHAAVLAEAERRPEVSRMATTLTLGVAVWPHYYIVQVGDSRGYLWYDGQLSQVTRDQTMAQHLVDIGALPREHAARSPLNHVLIGAIGGSEATPVVSKLSIPRGCVVLLCTDGLTKHVSDAEIAERIRVMESSEELCRSLLKMALDRGGSDNVTILVGRARAKRAD